MNFSVRCDLTLYSELRTAQVALVWFLFGVCPHVVGDTGWVAEVLATHGAQIRSDSGVRSSVDRQVLIGGEPLEANGTFELLHFGVDFFVSVQAGVRVEIFTAFAAEVLALVGVSFFVGF